MNSISTLHEDRKQAHADLAIADELKALIHGQFTALWMTAMSKVNDASLGMRDHLEKQIDRTLGRDAANEVITELTFQLRSKAVDVVGESIIRPRPTRHQVAAE